MWPGTGLLTWNILFWSLEWSRSDLVEEKELQWVLWKCTYLFGSVSSPYTPRWADSRRSMTALAVSTLCWKLAHKTLLCKVRYLFQEVRLLHSFQAYAGWCVQILHQNPGVKKSLDSTKEERMSGPPLHTQPAFSPSHHQQGVKLQLKWE